MAALRHPSCAISRSFSGMNHGHAVRARPHHKNGFGASPDGPQGRHGPVLTEPAHDGLMPFSSSLPYACDHAERMEAWSLPGEHVVRFGNIFGCRRRVLEDSWWSSPDGGTNPPEVACEKSVRAHSCDEDANILSPGYEICCTASAVCVSARLARPSLPPHKPGTQHPSVDSSLLACRRGVSLEREPLILIAWVHGSSAWQGGRAWGARSSTWRPSPRCRCGNGPNLPQIA